MLNFIKNIIKYRKFLKEDKWFDYMYIFKMLREKLYQDMKEYKKKAWSINADIVIQEMQSCVNTLDKIIEDKYDIVEFDKLDKRWGEIDITTELMDSGYYKLNFSREFVKTPEDEEKYKQELKNAVREADKNKQRDIDKLFNIMKEKIIGWWD